MWNYLDDLYYNNRENKRGGGVAAYVRQSLKCKIRKDFCSLDTDIKHLWLELAYRNSWVLDARVPRWTLDAGLWTLDAGRWTLNAGIWTLDSVLWTLDTVVDCCRTESESSF